MKKCLVCGDVIPKNRKSSAIYCSYDHYYTAKRNRSYLDYQRKTKLYKELQRCDQILATLHLLITKSRASFTPPDLEKLGFDFDICEREMIFDGRAYKSVGQYGYHIDMKSNKIKIIKWK